MKAIPFLFLALVVSILLSANHAQAQSTIFVTRHEDRGAEEPDPDLTAKGRVQAEALAMLLADTKVTHIFTTEFVRTQQTAAPLAQRTGVKPVIVPQKEFDALIAQIRATAKTHDGESILVVGHRATVPKIVKALTHQEIPPLGSAEYTRLIAITLFPDGRSSLVTLRQAAP